jgi:hypothetical protein
MFVICAEDALNSLGARTSTFLVIVTGWPVLLPLDHRPAPSRFTPWQLSPPVLLIAAAQLRPPEMEFQRRTDPPPDLVFHSTQLDFYDDGNHTIHYGRVLKNFTS